jgi:DNA-3-methyladenine glycosylase
MCGNGGVLVARDFLARLSVQVAPEVLGCVLEHETPQGLVAVQLTETEAYTGRTDPASHAYRGKTQRNAVMFGPPGHAYVYFTYGMHFCVNLVCLCSDGSASAVLLRAGAIIAGEDLARARRTRRKPDADRRKPAADRRKPDADRHELAAGRREPAADRPPLASRDLARGPARLCQALAIDRSLDGADVCVLGSPLRLRWPPAEPSASTAARSEKIASGPRVGVSSAAEVPWRFWVAGDPTVSVYRAHVPRRRNQQSANRLPPSGREVAPCRRGRHHR